MSVAAGAADDVERQTAESLTVTTSTSGAVISGNSLRTISGEVLPLHLPLPPPLLGAARGETACDRVRQTGR